MADNEDMEEIIPNEVVKDSNIAGTTKGMYMRSFRFVPTKSIKTPELLEILTAMGVHFGPEVFETLSEESRRHFVVHERDGSSYRYGTKRR
jgi:hypothetical protein